MKLKIFISLFLLISQSNFILNEILSDQNSLKNDAIVDLVKSTNETKKETSLNENEEGLVNDEENDNQINTSESYESNLNLDDNNIKLLTETKLEVLNEYDKNLVDNLNTSKDSDESNLEKISKHAQNHISETVSDHATVPSKLKETVNEAKDLLEEQAERMPILTDDSNVTAKEKVEEYTDKIPILDKQSLVEKVPKYDVLAEKAETFPEDTKEKQKEQPRVPSILKEDKVVDKLEETRDQVPSLDDLKKNVQDLTSEHAIIQDDYDTAKEIAVDYMDKIPKMEETKEKAEDLASEKTKEKAADYGAKIPLVEDVKEKTNEWIDQVTEKTSDSSQMTQTTIQVIEPLNEERNLAAIDEEKVVDDFVEIQKDNLNLAKEYAANLYVSVDEVEDEVIENSLDSDKSIEIHPGDRIEELIEKSLEFDDYFDALVRKLRERFHIIGLGENINPVYLSLIFIYITIVFVYLIQYFYKKRHLVQKAKTRTETKTDMPKQKNGKKFYPPASKKFKL